MACQLLLFLVELTEFIFLYRVLEFGDLGLPSEAVDRLLVQHEAYCDIHDCCVKQLIGQQAA